MRSTPTFTPKQLSATANVCNSDGILGGVFCSSSTAGTLTIYDDAATGTTTKIVDTFTLVAGTWYPLPLGVANGIYCVVGGTASITVAYTRG